MINLSNINSQMLRQTTITYFACKYVSNMTFLSNNKIRVLNGYIYHTSKSFENNTLVHTLLLFLFVFYFLSINKSKS